MIRERLPKKREKPAGMGRRGDNPGMKQENQSKETLQCMKDCGCSEEQAMRYLALHQSDNISEQLQFLYCQRRKLMNELHDAQKKIDCIDYVIRQLEQQKLQGKKSEAGIPRQEV